MKKTLKYASVLAAALVVSSCTKDFEEINTNNNAPSNEQAAPDYLLTNAIESLTDRVHEIFLGHEMGSGWVQHMAKVQYTDEDRYQFRPGTVNTTWNSFYAASGMDVVTIYKLGEKLQHDNYKGVALVLKAYIISVLTDLHGDIPYEEAFKGDVVDGGILSPTYNTQEEVYRDIIAKLKEANTLLSADGKEIGGDLLFGNDIDMWKKFANSLRLRLLLRMSDRDPGFVTTEMTEIVSTPATYPIFESHDALYEADDEVYADNTPDDMAYLKYLGSAPNNNPIHENRKTRDDHRVSENFIDLLKDLGDYRIMAFALPAGTGQFVGLPNGLTSAKAAAFNGGGLKNTSKIGAYFSAAEAPGMLMSFAELQFILAEAAKRNFIPGGDAAAESYYIQGFVASYNQFREPLQEEFDAHAGSSYGGLAIPADYTVDAEIFGHLTENAIVIYDPAKALEQIATQKYVAMFDQGLQAWFEWRRVDFPVLTPAQDGLNGGKIPVRVPYPLDEQSKNPSNYAAAVQHNGADNLNTRVWWDVD
ncbi:SusD/RagB family nutrient-binding outer membrane lipoprotein [Pseudochryseolinea flava]|uniref:SusD/RagB family nutrient-binding outer membrane lipoprotein n=1 Tax=Pseudochryseolinea flava TaxID=2059302 RepID=A0A364Y004_9BACT|nr:SusD/RagB family nutrient-binding outer membrane lipoprotein [Pseudochryseolinea flava]RAV99910.1 hypothetical protein DQQ10_17890 [Pseudochryseolinea flava]